MAWKRGRNKVLTESREVSVAGTEGTGDEWEVMRWERGPRDIIRPWH